MEWVIPLASIPGGGGEVGGTTSFEFDDVGEFEQKFENGIGLFVNMARGEKYPAMEYELC